ncbi:MAG TPA: hypothetical protein VF440_04965 [Novosphingobium sp.]
MASPSFADGLSSPARIAFSITPGAAPLAYAARAIRAGADGTITVRGVGQEADVVHPVFAGELVPLRVSHVTACSPAMTIIGYA